jgi:hypothetical protein
MRARDQRRQRRPGIEGIGGRLDQAMVVDQDTSQSHEEALAVGDFQVEDG